MIYVLDKERSSKFKHLDEFMIYMTHLQYQSKFPDGGVYVMYDLSKPMKFPGNGLEYMCQQLIAKLVRSEFTNLMICL